MLVSDRTTSGVQVYELIVCTIIVPPAPIAIIATPGNGAATLSWVAPTSTETITSYITTQSMFPFPTQPCLARDAQVTLYPGGSTHSRTTLSDSWSGLTNLDEYYFSVSSVSIWGTGPPSLSNSFLPRAIVTWTGGWYSPDPMLISSSALLI
jgi:hypothetical protein